MLTSKARRREGQVRAVLAAMEPLTQAEVVAATAAVAQCAADLQRNFGSKAARVPPEEIVLLAAYDAATLAPPRSFVVGGLNLTAMEGAAFCARIRAAAEAVARKQNRRGVLDGFKALDEAPPHPDRA